MLTPQEIEGQKSLLKLMCDKLEYLKKALERAIDPHAQYSIECSISELETEIDKIAKDLEADSIEKSKN